MLPKVVLIVFLLRLHSAQPGPTGTTERPDANVHRLQEIVEKLRDYVKSVLEELSSYEDHMKQESGNGNDYDRTTDDDTDDMVVVAEGTEEPATAATTTSEPGEPENEPEECHCDCEKQDGTGENGLEGAKTGKRDINGGAKHDKNVALILQTIRDMLKEANLHRLA